MPNPETHVFERTFQNNFMELEKVQNPEIALMVGRDEETLSFAEQADILLYIGVAFFALEAYTKQDFGIQLNLATLATMFFAIIAANLPQPTDN